MDSEFQHRLLHYTFYLCTKHFLLNGFRILAQTFVLHFVHHINTVVCAGYHLIEWKTMLDCDARLFPASFKKGSLKSLELNVITRHYTAISTMRLLGKQIMATFPRILRMF